MAGLLALASILLLSRNGSPSTQPSEVVDAAVWWLTSADPPRIELSPPTDPVRGTLRLDLEGDDRERVDVVSVLIDGTPANSGHPIVIETAALPDGPHVVDVTLRARSMWRTTYAMQFSFESDNTPPQVDLILLPESPVEGRALIVRASSDEPSTLAVEFAGRTLETQDGPGYRWAITGFSPGQREPAALMVHAADRAGNVTEWGRTLSPLAARLPVENVAVPARFQPLLSPTVRAQEDEVLAAVYAQASGPALWGNAFLSPIRGPIVTPFGTPRTYNDRPEVVYHAGVDMAAANGAEVRAVNNGIVAFAGQLEIRGNALVIEHGAGIFSTYAHLSEILVQPGERVTRERVVGRVGSTGLSTGPHLHWEMWAGGASVDPADLIDRPFP